MRAISRSRVAQISRPLCPGFRRGFGRGAGQADEVLWDAIGSEFGARHELYEVNYSGSHEEIRRFAILGANASGQAQRWKEFTESCMAEYDLDGWTTPDLINPDDVSVLR